MLTILTALQVSDIRRLFLRNEVQDVLLAEVFQNHVDLLRLEATLAGNETLVDEVVVDEESTVISQQGRDDFLFVGRVVLQTIELVTTDGKHHAGFIILFLCIFDVACTVQNFQSRVDLDREVAEGVTELVDIELEGGVIA